MRITFLVLLFGFLYLGLAADIQEQEKVTLTQQEQEWLQKNPVTTIGVMADFVPFSYSENGRFTGLVDDLLNLISQRTGLQFEKKADSWSSIYNAFKEGRFSMIADISYNEERTAFTSYTDPYYEIPTVVFVRDDFGQYTGIESLQGKKVGIARDIFYAKTLKNLGTMRIIEYDNNEDIVKALSFGELDAVVQNLSVINYYIRKNNLVNLRVASELELAGVGREDLRFGINKDKPELYSIIRKGMKSIKEEEIRLLINHWVGIELSTKTGNTKKIGLDQKELEFIKKHPSIRIANDSEWAPFDFFEHGKAKGFNMDFLRLLSEDIGIKLEFVQGKSWDDLIQRFESKEIDVITAYQKIPEHEPHALFTEPILESFESIITKKNAKPLRNYHDLYGKKVAVVRGYSYEDEIKNNHPDITLVLVDQPVEGLRKVSYGEADAFLENQAVAGYLIRKYAISTLAFTGDATFPGLEVGSEIRIATRKDWPELHTIFVKAMKTLSEEQIRTLEHRWLANKTDDKEGPSVLLTPTEQRYLENKKEIYMCVDPDWMPYERINEQGKHEGISADYMQLISERIGRKFTLIPTKSWDESIQKAKARECDFLTLLNETPERAEYLNFTSPVFTSHYVMIARNNEGFIPDLQDVSHRKVGVVKGYATEELLKRDYPEMNLHPVESVEKGLQLVASGELDILVDSLSTASLQIQRLGLANLKIVGKTPYTDVNRIGVRNDEPDLRNILDKAVLSVSSQERDRIMQRWFAVKFEQAFDYSLLWKVLTGVGLLLVAFFFWNRKLSQLNKQLALAKAKAESATQEKSNFLANMSHEIRTPMNAIIGMTYLAKQTELTSTQSDYIHKIENSANALLGIINDILDFSKIEAGKLEIEEVDFELHTVIENVTTLVEIKAMEKDLEFIVSYDQGMNMQLHGDPLRLGQVLTNLANNAVKFTSQGEVGIYITRIEEERYRFEVRDTGIGLTKEQQGRLFQSFSQADTSTTRKFGGTGLGLAISKQLVEMMEGQIWVESEYKQGSRFIFEVTLKEQEKSDKEVKEFADKKVLIVDDTPSWQTILKRHLDEFNINVSVAGSGEEAIKMMCGEGQHFDMVLMDWRMPGMDGVETTRMIKEKCQNLPTTIIMVSAYRQETVLNAAKEQGIDVFLQKPINPSLLYDVIMETFGAGIKKEIQKNVDMTSLKQELTTLKGSTILLAEDNSMNREIIHGMLGHSGIIIEEALNGEEAVQMYNENPSKYELILMDIQMPVMDGYEATQAIREQDTDIPIIALTANALVSDIQKTKSIGMNEHLNKPIEVERLFKTLLQYISKKCDAETITGSTSSESENALPVFETIDTKAGLSHMVGDVTLYTKILRDFVHDYAHITEALRRAITENEQEAKRLVHTIKGLSANIGAKALHEVAFKLDETLDSSLLEEFEQKLVAVITEIKNSPLFAEKAEESGEKPSLDERKRGELFEELKEALKKRRPHLINPVLEMLETYTLSQKDSDVLEQLKPLIKKYKFKDALNIIEE